MSWIFGGLRAKFSRSSQQMPSEGRKTPKRSQSDGRDLGENKSIYAPRTPHRGSTVPPLVLHYQEQSTPIPQSPRKYDDIRIEMPAAHQGTYSTVYKGSRHGGSVSIRATRAVKAVDGTRKELERERAVWFKLEHENIQPLLGVITRPDLSPYDCTVSLWYQNGSLSKYMKRQRVPASLRVRLIRDVAEGICYLHSLDPSIVHGDLKPSNVLIDSNNRAIVCDFGIAQSIRDELSKNMTTTVSKVNSIRYLAPELVTGTSSQGPTTYSDVWSLACVIYEIIYFWTPYAHIEAKGNTSQLSLFTEISNGRPPAKRPSNISKEVAQLWKSVLEPSWSARPNKRPAVASICQYVEQHATALSLALP